MTICHLYLSPGHNYRGHHGGPPGDHPIEEVPSVECVAGRGLVGDRYFDYKPDFKGQITFFAWENLVAMWEQLGLAPHLRDPSATRRNVVVEGLDLNALIGKDFSLQGIRFLGTEECKPCYWMNGAIHPEAEAWMQGRGGLRAKILTDGILRLEATRTLAAVLLAGGQSTRMGRDKALLEINGQPLWQRQVELLRKFSSHVGIATPVAPSWLGTEDCWIPDEPSVQGPLAGVLAALRWAAKISADHLLVLAVDMPSMKIKPLLTLLRACRSGIGAVPVDGGHFEPLAAIYPASALPVLEAAAAAGRWKMQDAMRSLVNAGAMLPQKFDDTSAFCNVNTPEQLAEWSTST